MSTTHALPRQVLGEATGILNRDHRHEVVSGWGHGPGMLESAVAGTEASVWFTEQDLLDHLSNPGFLAQQQVLLREKTQQGNHAATGRADVLASVRSGASVQVRHLEAFLPRAHPVLQLAEELEHLTGHAVDSVTLFQTHPGEQALPRHEDSSDVYALQLSGAKHWDVADRSWQLSAGDLAYIPAHTQHEVRPVGDTVSLSLAYVMRAVSLRDVLHARLDDVIAELGPAPRVPLLSGRDDVWAGDAGLAHYLSAVLERMAPGPELNDLLRSRVLADRLPPRMVADEVGDALVPRAPCWVVDTAAGVEVRVAGGGRFAGPAELRAAIEEALDDDSPCTVASLERRLPAEHAGRGAALVEVLCDIGALRRVASHDWATS